MDDPLAEPPFSQAEIALFRSLLRQMPSQALLQAQIGPTGTATNTSGTPVSNGSATILHGNIGIAHPPAVAAQVSGRPTSTAPPVTPYQGIRGSLLSHGHPSVSRSLPQSVLASSAPPNVQFQGIRSLGAGVACQIANQQRRSSAAATLPHPPALQARGSRRGRGSAIAPPGLPATPTMQNAIITNDDGSTSIRIKVKVYPPTESPRDDIFLYRTYIDSFNMVLESFFLLQEYELPSGSRLSELMEKVTEHLQTCPLEYCFSTRFPPGVIRHEAFPITLLALSNRGRIRQSDGQIRLQRLSATTGSTSVSELMANSNYYGNPRFCLEGNRFVIHFIISHHPVTVRLGNRLHKCLSSRIYHQFPYDGYVEGEDDVTGHDDKSSGGESDADEMDISTDNEDNNPHPSTHRHVSVIEPGLRLVPRTMAANRSTSVTVAGHSCTVAAERSINRLPSLIWAIPWHPPAANYGIINLSSIQDVSDHMMRHSRPLGSPEPKLSIRGNNVIELASVFHQELAAASATKDYSKILSPDREFIINNPDGSIQSIGPGIEAEVMFAAFSEQQKNPGQWFYPRIDDTASIAVMHTYSSAGNVSTGRLEGMRVFGALSALLLLQGIPPTPLSFVLLHWIIHDCDIHSIHPDIVTEWHPELSATIKRWLSLGPQSEIVSFRDHFSAWHENQIGLYVERDEISHKSLAAEMLYRPIIGPEPSQHPEIQAFIEGFRLPCPNGFDFINVLRSFEGGAELFLNMVWTSQIKGIEDLEPHITYRLTPQAIAFEAFSRFPDPTTTLGIILRRFLSGSGIPCPALFHHAKMHFTELLDLSKIDDPSFRSRMFCWAATGVPSLNCDTSNITVFLVGDQDTSYTLPAYRDAMIAEGKISFKTCNRQVRIPASYLNLLSQASYDGNSDSEKPKSLEDAIHHWFLVEILNAIGQHSIL